MNHLDIIHSLNELVPGANFTTRGVDINAPDFINWEDERPMPSREAIEQKIQEIRQRPAPPTTFEIFSELLDAVERKIGTVNLPSNIRETINRGKSK